MNKYTFLTTNTTLHFGANFSKILLPLLLLVLAGCLSPICATSITIANFGGVSTNMTFSSGTWSPTGSPAQLDVADLIAKLELGDVTVTTNGAGDISFTGGHFSYVASAARHLELSAGGNVVMTQAGHSGAAVNCTVHAGGNVIIGGSGWDTNGGSFTSDGVNFSITGAALATDGGEVHLTHSGSVNLAAAGVTTGGGAFYSSGTNISIHLLRTEGGTGGKVTLLHTGDVAIFSAAVVTGGGAFYSEGQDLSISGTGVNTSDNGGGKVTFVHTGFNVSIQQGGVNTGGKDFSSQGLGLSISGGGVRTEGGNFLAEHTGPVGLGNVTTEGGTVTSKGTTLMVTEEGVESGGGKVRFEHSGDIEISGTGLNTAGGDLESGGAGELTVHGSGIELGGAANVCIHHAKIALYDDGLSGNNAAANIMLSARSMVLGAVILQGNLKLRCSGSVSIDGTGIVNNGGVLNVDLKSNSIVLIGSKILSGGGNIRLYCFSIGMNNSGAIKSGGGNIELTCKEPSFLLGVAANMGGISSEPGTGGILTTTALGLPPIFAIDVEDPVVGMGNITLTKDPDLVLNVGAVCRDLVVEAGEVITADEVLVSLSPEDFCAPIAGYSLDRSSFTCDDMPATYVSLTVTDENGSPLHCTAHIVISDLETPTITCPSDIARSTDPNQCHAVVQYTVTASDNCPVTPVRTSPSSTQSGSAFPTGSTTVQWSVTDGIGQSATCSFTVTVADTQPPSITCPDNLTRNTDAGQCSAMVTYETPTYSDNCAATPALTSGLASGSAFPKGLNVVQWEATDGAGLTKTCSFTVTVVDNQPPSITCPSNLVRNTDAGQCSAVTPYAVAASDNCPGATTTVTAGLSSGSAFPKGTTTVEVKATDAAGFTASCQFTVTVVDNQPPSIICPMNIVRNTDANLCSAVVAYTTPTYSDNCAGSSAAILPNHLPSGSTFPKGVTLVSWKATDAAGLTAICQFTVTVNDAQLPSIACPSNQTVGSTPTLCTGIATFATPSGADNCALPPNPVTQTSGPASGSAFPKGQTVVTFRVTDAAGLTKTCTFRVTVNDTENPLIACPSSQSANTDAGTCTTPVTYPTPTATDNCGSLTVARTSGPASGSQFPAGTTNVVWRAIDGAGRSSTCSFSVTVMDATPPAITCPGSQSVSGSGSPCVATVGYTTPTATDNCGIQSVFLLSGLPSGSSFPAGATNITWRAVDNSGLSATCAFTVTVNCGASPDPSEGGESVTAERDVASPPLRGGREGLSVGLLLSPNPATTEVTISIENLGETGGELTILDAQGRLMWQSHVQHPPSHVHRPMSNVQHPTSHVALDNFAAGVYFVTLRAEGKTATKRLVVARQ